MISFIASMLFSFILFFWISLEVWKKNVEMISNRKLTVPDIALGNHKHVAGILFLGILPFAQLPASTMTFMSMYLFFDGRDVVSFAFLLILSFLMAVELAEKKKRVAKYEQEPKYRFNKEITLYLALRILYVICYEFFFRGFLLFGCIPKTGIVAAVIVNIIASMFMHIYCEKAEVMGRVPYCLALCWVCLSFSSVWPAVASHLVLSLVFDLRLYNYQFIIKKNQ